MGAVATAQCIGLHLAEFCRTVRAQRRQACANTGNALVGWGHAAIEAPPGRD